MGYKILGYFLAVIGFIAFWQHLVWAYTSFQEGNYLYFAYNISVSALLFLALSGNLDKFGNLFIRPKSDKDK